MIIKRCSGLGGYWRKNYLLPPRRGPPKALAGAGREGGGRRWTLAGGEGGGPGHG